MKNILVLIHDDAGQEARLQAALDITRALGGHLTCVDVAQMMPIVSDYFPAMVAGMVLEDRQERANREHIQRRLIVEGVPWDWRDMTGDLAHSLAAAADLADLIVVNRRLDKEPWPNMLSIAAKLILTSDKPIVAVPDTVRRFNTFGPALIAWDGSAEASRALRATVPLLRLADKVLVLEVDDGTLEAPAADAAAYLSRHGIRSTLLRQQASAEATADILLAQANLAGAAYIVMGGFGRGRIVEALLGGVSHRLLSESPSPLVLAH
jgi:nucleotide-binding universal stress UspA family protein